MSEFVLTPAERAFLQALDALEVSFLLVEMGAAPRRDCYWVSASAASEEARARRSSTLSSCALELR